tara:strand:- start:1508 stop:2281 length:774 start_codon:yes stop_codon:yes gene_type:complete
MTKKAVAKQEPAGLPAALAEEMAADAGDGRQGVTTQDMAIPFLRILQSGSPQLKKQQGEYIEGASEGDLLNTVTGEIWEGEEGCTVIPCAFQFKYIVWKPRDSGGGFVASHTRDDELPSTEADERGRAITGEGNILTDTAEHYVMIVDAEGHCEQAVITMSSSGLKSSRKWNSMMAQHTIPTSEGVKAAPTYARKYKMTTMGLSNDQGDWSGWSIANDGDVENIDIYRACRAFSKAVNEGSIQAKHVTGTVEGDSVM